MKNVLIFLFILSFTSAIYAQDNKTTFGVELGITPFKNDNFSENYLFSLSGYVGFWGEVKFIDRFTTKFSAGIHNIYFRNFEYDVTSGIVYGRKGDFTNTLQLSVEPRYYLFPATNKWGTCYAALPITFETAPLDMEKINTHLDMRILPTLGYRYTISKHWITEASAGLGWEKVLKQYGRSVFKYDLTARISYVF